MVGKIVERPKLRWWQQLYLPQIVQGLRLTWKQMFKKGITVQYPEERQEFFDDYRGAPGLVEDQEGREKCVSCQLCEFICPPKAIVIEPGEIGIDSDAETDLNQNIEKAPKAFFIDMLRCIYCGYCEEVCPEEAIFMTDVYELNGATREELVYDKKKLYELGGTRVDAIQKWKGK
ncbi:MAG: NADH-quinone oxidoreductase subunit I [Planctomycetota bacterium]|nr:NADH-quinone oxidoreductase subunit I [Planctomycetota bacterium]